MRIIYTTLLGVAAVSFSGLLSGTPLLSADIVLTGPIDYGHGFGNAPRMLTVQSTGNTPAESGCVGFAGGSMSVGTTGCSGMGAFAPAGGDEPNPHGSFPKFNAPTLGSLGYTNASQIQILFDATEPGSTTSLTMNQLVLKIYSPTGKLLMVNTLVSPGLVLDPTVEGNGRFDYGFALNAAGIALANSAIFGTAGYQNDVITLESTMSSVHGGPESFVAAAVIGGSTVPEPAGVLMISTGLLGLLALSRRKAR
jgi:hypothetical protein